MLNLSNIAKFEKNRLISDTAWIILLEITLVSGLIMRFCSNNEDIDWNGFTWIAFPFDFDYISQGSDGRFPHVTVSVSNVTRTVEGYLEQEGGGVGAKVRVMVVMSTHLDIKRAEQELEFTVKSTSYNREWVVFVLSGAINLQRRVPERRFFKNFCPFMYKGPECRSVSELPTCDKTLKNCKERLNATRFGGEPGIPMGGLYNARE